jgi:uncharacterized protein
MTGFAWRFLSLTFLWSWASWGIAAVSTQEWTAFPTVVFYVLGGIGPTLAAVGLVWSGASSESPGVFLRRWIDYRGLGAWWFVVILAIAIVPNALARLVPPGSGTVESSSNEVILPALVAVAVLAGVAEEPGWRGYLLDTLGTARSGLVSGVIVGIVWTVWHLPFYFIRGTIQQEAGLWSQDFWWDMANRIPLAVLFAWIYLETGRSILSAILLHAADNLASVFIDPQGNQLIIRFVAVTALAGVAVWFRRRRMMQGHALTKSASA